MKRCRKICEIHHTRNFSHESGGLYAGLYFCFAEVRHGFHFWGSPITLNMRNEKIAQNSVSTNSQLDHDPGDYCDFIFFEKLRNGCHFWGSQALSIWGMKRSRKIASPPTRSFIMIRGVIATLCFSRKWEMDVTFAVHQHSQYAGMKRSRKLASPPTRSFIMIRGIIATLFFSRHRETDVTFGVHKHSQYAEWKDRAK